MTVALVRTSVRAASGVMPLRPATSTIRLHIAAVARVIVRIDQFEIAPRPDREAESLQPLLDDRRAADQHRLGQPLLHHDLRRAQDALVLALGIDHALGRGLRLREHRLHDEAGAEHEAVEPLL